jgi:uncharacterized membrane protein (UPF0127 family)
MNRRPKRRADMGWNEQAYRGSRTVVTTFALALLVAVGCGAAGEEAPGDRSRADTPPAGTATVSPPAGHAWVIFGADTVVAEVAATADERAEGLMYRDEVPDGTGMLFVFQNSEVRSFWMANTYVALDIAYMDVNYTVVDIIAMEPLVTDSYPSQAPAMYALEVRQGWFEQEEIAIGAHAMIEFGVQSGRLN